eukprot:5220672-Pyramimonas_sp.AAC.1
MEQRQRRKQDNSSSATQRSIRHSSSSRSSCSSEVGCTARRPPAWSRSPDEAPDRWLPVFPSV